MSRLVFKKQENGNFKFEEGNYSIIYNKDNETYFYVNGEQIAFYKFDNLLDLLRNIRRLHQKYKPPIYDFNKPFDDISEFKID